MLLENEVFREEVVDAEGARDEADEENELWRGCVTCPPL